MTRFQDQTLEEGIVEYDRINPTKNKERVNTVFLTNFLGSCFGVVVKILESTKKMHNPQGSFLQTWNKIFLPLCGFAVALDPVFLYVPVVNRDKNCFELDKKLGITPTVLRSIIDILCIIDIVFQFRTDFPDHSSPASKDDKNAWETVKRYLSPCFAINILAILPLPQVALFIIIPKVKGSRDSKVTSWFISVVFLQYLPRLYRIIPVYKKVAKTADWVTLPAWAKAAWNLFLYMIFSHIFGAFWYFFSIARKAACWKKACNNYAGCVQGSFFCEDNVGDNTFLNDFCPIKTPNTTLFDFGIFNDALQSGIVESTDFQGKLFSCFWWGLRNLSSLGQNLNTSNYIWETCFALGISVSGLLLLVFLIGNMQTYLQSNIVRSEEKSLNRLKVEKIDKWMTSRKLTEAFGNEIKDFLLQSNWQDSEGFNWKNLLYNLPEGLHRKVKHELCLKLLNQVPKFKEMGDQMLNVLCDHVKLVFHTEYSYTVHRGDPIDQMLFVTRGNLSAYSYTTRKITTMTKDNYCGEELIDWALTSGRSNSNLPISTKTTHALTDVEGFALLAVDLKNVITTSLILCNPQRPHTLLIANLEKTLAVCTIQIIWLQQRKRNRVRSHGEASIREQTHGGPSIREQTHGGPSIRELSHE